MTAALTDQIRDYFADIETRQRAGDLVEPIECEHPSTRTLESSRAHPSAMGAGWWATLVAAAAVVALVATLVAVRSVDDDDNLDAVDAAVDSSLPEPSTDASTLTSVAPAWSGAVRDRSNRVQPMVVSVGEVPPTFTWRDPLDASVGWADVERVVYSPQIPAHWYIELAAEPPPAAGLDPGLIIAYGLVFDTTGDGVADYEVGIDNDAPEQGDFHVWVTDLATGETDEQIGPPYGFPVEFRHPDEYPDDLPGPPTMMFTFPGGPRGPMPADLDPATVRFYAWTSATLDGETFAWDYAPDTGWISPEAR